MTHTTGDVIGRVVQKPGTVPTYKILDPSGKLMLMLIGPEQCGYCTCCRDIYFRICLPREPKGEIGRITVHWAGIINPASEDEYDPKLGICFPRELDAQAKAILIGAFFLIVSSFIPVFLISHGVFEALW